MFSFIYVFVILHGSVFLLKKKRIISEKAFDSRKAVRSYRRKSRLPRRGGFGHRLWRFPLRQYSRNR